MKCIFQKQFWRSISFKMIFIFVLMIIAMALLMGAILSFSIQENQFQEEKHTNQFNLVFAMEEIDNDLKQIKNLFGWCMTNNETKEFLQMDKNNSALKRQQYIAYQSLYQQFIHNLSNPYLLRMMLIAPNGTFISHGSIFGTADDHANVQQLPYFEKLSQGITYQWFPLEDEYFGSVRKSYQVLPLSRTVLVNNQSDVKGYVYASIDTTLFTDIIEKFILDIDYLFLQVGDSLYQYIDGRFILQNSAFVQKGCQSGEVFSKNGKEYLYLSTPSVEADIQLIQIIPSFFSFSLSNPYVPIAMSLLVVFILLMFWFTLQKMVSKPIVRISKRIERVARGDLSKTSHKKYSVSEFGNIERGIDSMTTSISHLMNEKLYAEQVKRNLEISILQNQINPHFLYNTLNTIKWMGTIQGAHGISEIATSLGILLRNLAHNKEKTTTLENELEMLKTYLTIQQYRYGDTVSFHLITEEGYDSKVKILRLLLQPLIENAIFHGIEPTGKPGHIYLTIRMEKTHIAFEIKDDGAGISTEKLSHLLPSEQEDGETYQQYVGLRNVHMRLRYEFGPQYGLRVKSQEGVGTTISFIHPYIVDEGGTPCTK